MHGAKGRHPITPDSHKCYHCSALLRRAALSNNALLVLLRRCDDAQLALVLGYIVNGGCFGVETDWIDCENALP